MSVPVLVVTGFLGAGKTTFINQLLQGDHGRRIAAIVNDFGSINIDAALLDSRAEGVIGLKNGCICCSLQGDLLRTLKQVLSRLPVPELIVIEASGVADPAGIVQSLMDPVIWSEAKLETVIGIVDALDAAKRQDDPLWRAQVRGSDLLCLSKTMECSSEALSALTAALAVQGRKHIFDASMPIPLDTLFIEDKLPRGTITNNGHKDTRFSHLEWTYDGKLDLQEFQASITRLAGVLLRAKGFVEFEGRCDQMLFQLAGNRVALSLAPDGQESGCRLVLIGERRDFDSDTVRHELDRLKKAK